MSTYFLSGTQAGNTKGSRVPEEVPGDDDDRDEDDLHDFDLQEMCASIGVDPLASNKGFWSNMLDIGDFYYELGTSLSLSVPLRSL